MKQKLGGALIQAIAVSVLLYGGTNYILTKDFEKKLDGNDTRTLRSIPKKIW